MIEYNVDDFLVMPVLKQTDAEERREEEIERRPVSFPVTSFDVDIQNMIDNHIEDMYFNE